MPWFRKMRRATLPEKDALADAEEELLELYTSIEADERSKAKADDGEADLMEEVMEEQQALRELLQKQQAEIEELRKKLTVIASEEAACATFLASSVGRQFVMHMARLEDEKTLLQQTIASLRSLLAGSVPPADSSPVSSSSTP